MDQSMHSKMDIEKQIIYDIYRACRLCGGGAGYKMPIVQDVLDLQGRDIELREKIWECVQIKVHRNDRMPPLICELCVDKVNDFYEFSKMCRETNDRTRIRLGLPPETQQRGASDSKDCILGVTEPIYISNDSNKSTTPKHKSKQQKSKVKREYDVIIKKEPEEGPRRESRSSSRGGPAPAPAPAPVPSPLRPRPSRHGQPTDKKQPVSSAPLLKSILKKEREISVEDDSLLVPRKRTREMDRVKQECLNKRVKISFRPLPQRSSAPTRPADTSRPPSSRKQNWCDVCKQSYKTPQALYSHQRVHLPNYIRAKNSRLNQSAPSDQDTPTGNCKEGKCKKCGRSMLKRSLRRHDKVCKAKKEEFEVDPVLIGQLRPLQVRVARCDPLLATKQQCNVANISQEYGLDNDCIYPYISSVRSLRVKKEPSIKCDEMVKINEDITTEFDLNESYVHWDSDISNSSDDETDGEPTVNSLRKKRKVDTLLNLTLRTVFSKKFLGKVPKRRRKLKTENVSETVENEFEENSFTIENSSGDASVYGTNNTDNSFDASLQQSSDSDVVVVTDSESVVAGGIDDNVTEKGTIQNDLICNFIAKKFSIHNSTTENLECRDKLDVNDKVKRMNDKDNGEVSEDLKYEDSQPSNKSDIKITESDSKVEIKGSKEGNSAVSNSSTNMEVGEAIETIQNYDLLGEEYTCEKKYESNSQLEDQRKGNIKESEDERKNVINNKFITVSNTPMENVDNGLSCEAQTCESRIIETKSNRSNTTTEIIKLDTVKDDGNHVNFNNYVVEDHDYLQTDAIKSECEKKEPNDWKHEVSCVVNQVECINASRNNVESIPSDTKEHALHIQSTKSDTVVTESDSEVETKNSTEKSIGELLISNSSTDMEETNQAIAPVQNHELVKEGDVGNDGKDCNTSSKGMCANGQREEKLDNELNAEDFEDISDIEMDDPKVMKVLDSELGDSDASRDATEKDKILLEDLLPEQIPNVKPMDMDSIVDDFDFDT